MRDFIFYQKKHHNDFVWWSSTYWISDFSHSCCRPCTPSPPVLRAVVIVLTIPPSFLCLLPVDTGLCSGQLSLVGFFRLWPSSWVIADKAPKLLNFWPLSFFVPAISFVLTLPYHVPLLRMQSCLTCKQEDTRHGKQWMFLTQRLLQKSERVPKPFVKPGLGLQLGL